MPAQNPIDARAVAAMIDHSLLRPEMTDREVVEGCELAIRYQTASVCVRPGDTRLASRHVAGTGGLSRPRSTAGVLVCTVIGFPHGNSTRDVKLYEALKALDDGADELDMVLAIGKLRSGDDAYVESEVRTIVEVAHARSAAVKVIFENYYLDDEQIVRACHIAEDAGADFVKTSTGYAGGGATLEHVRLMRRTCSPAVAVKAAGGIRTLDQLLQFRQAGAERIGTRSTAEMVQEALRRA